jgi:hypothetical protein
VSIHRTRFPSYPFFSTNEKGIIMAADSDDNGTFKVDGRQVLEFPLLDDQAQQELLRCIQEKKKIRIVINEIGQLDLKGAGYRQLID